MVLLGKGQGKGKASGSGWDQWPEQNEYPALNAFLAHATSPGAWGGKDKGKGKGKGGKDIFGRPITVKDGGWGKGSGDAWGKGSGDAWSKGSGDGWGDGWDGGGFGGWGKGGGDAWGKGGGDGWGKGGGAGWGGGGKGGGDDGTVEIPAEVLMSLLASAAGKGKGGSGKGGGSDKPHWSTNLKQVNEEPASPEEVEEFFNTHDFDDKAKARLQALHPKLQKIVINMGPLDDPKIYSQSLMHRCKQANTMRPGDWVCHGCGQINYTGKDKCFKCHVERSGGLN